MSEMSLENVGWGLVSFVSIPFALTYFRNLRKHVVDDSTEITSRNITILYGTTTGTSRRMAHEFKKKLGQVAGVTINVSNMKDYDFDSLDSENIVFILCSTWNYGEVPETARPFMEWLQDLANDFRISKNMLSKVRFSVMGLGGEVYGEHFCTAVKWNIFKMLDIVIIVSRLVLFMNPWRLWVQFLLWIQCLVTMRLICKRPLWTGARNSQRF
jgi:flavodoxin